MGQTMAPDNQQNQRRLESAALFGILVLAAVLRFFQVDAQSMSWDEFITLAESTGNYWQNEQLQSRNEIVLPPPNITALEESRSWRHVWLALEHQVHPPLYYMLLRIWRWMLGGGDVAARSLSVVLSIVAVGLVHWLGRLLYDWRVGLWAALIMALAAPQITYAQEVRSYALLLALGAAACVALVRIEKIGPSWGNVTALALAALGMALTHYFAFGALAALGIHALLRLRGKSLRRALIGFASAVVLFAIIWGPIFLEQRNNLGLGDFLLTNEPNHVLETLYRILEMPLRYVVSLGGERMPNAAGLLGVTFLVVPPLLLRKRRDLLLPWLWVCGSVGFLAVLDLARGTVHLNSIRYSLVGSVGLYLLIPALLWHMRPLRHALPAVAVIAAGVLIAGAYHPWKNHVQNYRGLALYVREQVPAGAPLVFQTVPPGPPPTDPRKEWSWDARRRLVAISHYAYSPQRPVIFLDGPALPELVRLLQGSGRFWVVTNPWKDPELSHLPQAQLVRGTHFAHVGNVYELSIPQSADKGDATSGPTPDG